MTKRLTKVAAFKRLAHERQMMSLIDRDIVSLGGDFLFHRSDWVSLYYDTGYMVTSDDRSQYAYRAITTRGELLWLVFSTGKSRGYHSEERCPFAAFEDAQRALAHRRFVKSRWNDVNRVASALRRGSLRFDVLIEDAHASPLCAMGTRHFLRSIGIPNVQRMSGFKLAWIMLIEPQLGFVIHEAALREGVLADLEAAPVGEAIPGA